MLDDYAIKLKFSIAQWLECKLCQNLGFENILYHPFRISGIFIKSWLLGLNYQCPNLSTNNIVLKTGEFVYQHWGWTKIYPWGMLAYVLTRFSYRYLSITNENFFALYN